MTGIKRGILHYYSMCLPAKKHRGINSAPAVMGLFAGAEKTFWKSFSHKQRQR
jgi:hypothetical protein